MEPAIRPTEASSVWSGFGPLEVSYDYAKIQSHLNPKIISQRAENLWRYRELLPVTGEPVSGFHSGYTPLVRSRRLAEHLGVKELYLKDDSVNRPTLSYKDRVVPVALSRGAELGYSVFACASTGNLANAVASPLRSGRFPLLAFHSPGHRSGQDQRLAHLQAKGGGTGGKLRRREPPVR